MTQVHGPLTITRAGFLALGISISQTPAEFNYVLGRLEISSDEMASAD